MRPSVRIATLMAAVFSGTAFSQIVVPPSIVKTFGSANIPVGGVTSLSFTITNANAGFTFSNVGVTDPLPAGLVIATPNGFTGSCGGGTITAVAGSGSISLAGGTMPPNTTCTFAVNVLATTSGTKVNTTGRLEHLSAARIR